VKDGEDKKHAHDRNSGETAGRPTAKFTATLTDLMHKSNEVYCFYLCLRDI